VLVVAIYAGDKSMGAILKRSLGPAVDGIIWWGWGLPSVINREDQIKSLRRLDASEKPNKDNRSRK
jgi:hypothetical protein